MAIGLLAARPCARGTAHGVTSSKIARRCLRTSRSAAENDEAARGGGLVRSGKPALRVSIRQALDQEGAELCQLVADRHELLEACRVAVGLRLLCAVPRNDNDACLGRLPFERGHFSSRGKEAAAGRLDGSLSARGEVLDVVGLVQHVDLGDLVDGRLALSVKAL